MRALYVGQKEYIWSVEFVFVENQVLFNAYRVGLSL